MKDAGKFDFFIKTKHDLVEAVNRFGFVPLFKNSIPGFSVEENVSRDAWFFGEEGVWEWKGPVIRSGNCVYGKFFEKKAGFINLEWLADFANYRRDGYDFDSRYDDGLAAHKDKYMYDTIAQHGSLLTKELKLLCNYCKDGNKGFETVITRLQMQTYVVIADFEYMLDKHGQQYGWGVARYSTPEQLVGSEAVTAAYSRTPEESKQRIFEYLKELLPQASEKAIWRIIGES